MLSKHYKERLCRQIQLKELGLDKQEAISKTKFLIIGAGGLGSPVSIYLAASGALNLTIVDPDVVSISNLPRQLLHDETRLDLNKAQSAKLHLDSKFPELKVKAINDYVTESSLKNLIELTDIVIDCSDNLATRHAINAQCHRLQKPLVFGSVVQFDGQVAVFDFTDPHSACLHCLFEPDDPSLDIKAKDVGVFSPMTGLVGTIMATEAIKLSSNIGSPLKNRLLLIEGLSMKITEIQLRQNPHCPICHQSNNR